MSSLITVEALNNKAGMSFKDIDKTKLPTYTDLKIDEGSNKIDKILKFLKDFENPYFTRHGEIIVKSTYSNENISMQECIINTLKRKLEREAY